MSIMTIMSIISININMIIIHMMMVITIIIIIIRDLHAAADDPHKGQVQHVERRLGVLRPHALIKAIVT